MGVLNTIGSVPDVEVDNAGMITISNMPVDSFVRYTRREYGAVNFVNILAETERNFFLNQYGTLKIYPFFIPEMMCMLNEAISMNFGGWRFKRIRDLLLEKTWFASSAVPVPSRFDMSVFGTVINKELQPLPAQLEFIRDTYYQKKVAYRLNGYLLSLPPGCGKSLTSLFLATGLHKKKIVIICPLSTVRNVWVNEVEKCFIQPKKIVTSLDKRKITATDEVIILNYEAIGIHTSELIKYCAGDDTMVIVDECHNFKDINAQRTKMLITACTGMNCHDILMMSGTPVKAFGAEAIPLLKLLDSFCTPEIVAKLKALGRYTSIMNALMCNRLGYMMFRKTKEEVFTLPEKYEYDLMVRVKNGKDFTLSAARKVMEQYRKERINYYNQHKAEYEDAFNRAISWYMAQIIRGASRQDQERFDTYMSQVTYLRSHNYSFKDAEYAHATRLYEDENIIPRLPNDLKKEFKAARAVVKYLELKVLGEMLGNVLGRLRIAMTSAMLDDPRIPDIIADAEKKTIMFSSYKDTIAVAAEACKAWGFSPVVIDGSNSDQAKELVAKFKADPKLNPLIASLQVMSTGHTINEANTVIFLNVPFRSVDYDQASDRCYRIGQDTDVYIYKLILDTGDEPNLSTRMQDIISWSREQFNEIMGESEIENIQNKSAVTDVSFMKMLRSVEPEGLDQAYRTIMRVKDALLRGY